jgi:hypothetical protein
MGLDMEFLDNYHMMTLITKHGYSYEDAFKKAHGKTPDEKAKEDKTEERKLRIFTTFVVTSIVSLITILWLFN